MERIDRLDFGAGQIRSCLGVLIRVSILLACLTLSAGDSNPNGTPARSGVVSTSTNRPPLSYSPQFGFFDADIRSWTLPQVLSRLSRVTGWQVFVEPGGERFVSTAFRNLPTREALPRLLGEFNFALMPRTNSPPQLFIYRTSLDSATQRVEDVSAEAGDSSANRKHELIVALKGDAKGKAEALAREVGAEITGRLDSANAFRLKFPDDASETAGKQALAASSDVESVEANTEFAQPEVPQKLDLSQAPELNLRPKVVGDKDRVIVGLVDTAVQKMGTEYDGFLLKGIQVGQGTAPEGELQHGTSMAETILKGVAFANGAGSTPVRILPVDVYGAAETTSTFELAVGLMRAIENGATIVNMSLGGTEDSPLLHRLIQNVTRDGVLVIASAGNEPVATPTYPAAYSEVLAVTAGNSKGQTASYANFGSFVDVISPGMSIIKYGGQAWMVTGTSPAAAYVSGLAGGLASQPGSTASQVRASIESKIPFSGKKP